MKRSWFPIFLVVALLGLLGVLGVLQYLWLGQVSEGERERMRKRLETDTQRFAEDFNREIQNAYFNFQTDEKLWKAKNWASFNERYDFWRAKTAYPNLIKNFYFWQTADDAVLLRYNSEKREFVETAWSDKLKNLKTKSADEKNSSALADEVFALVMPILEVGDTVNRILLRREEKLPPEQLEMPEKFGYLIIELDETVLKNQILNDLANKYFPGGEYNLAVVGKNEQKIFQTQEISSADASTKLFDLSPDNFMFFGNRELMSKMRTGGTGSVIINQKFESKSISNTKTATFEKKLPVKESSTFTLKVKDAEKPRTAFIDAEKLRNVGDWTLNVQHSAGSLETFITNTRRKNLAISFGILGLLGVSIISIFVSAQRAKLLAQRQIDFVSSVSHEFRTPLAVIYSAGENLADGVAHEEKQVSRYGNLIKGEGKKLSAMVEQILEFAGARSGRRKYDLRESGVKEIIENALAECQPLIEEKGFIVESEIAENLPVVKADSNALSQAIQNLITNSLKYSDGEKWLKISAANGGMVKIAVEDRGIGIAKNDLKHIFEPFYRAKSVVDEQIHGNGLGLSLVKDTVEAHGGRILAESEIGKGSKFTIELPKGKEIERG